MEWPNSTNVFIAEPVSPWAAIKSQEVARPDFADDEALKQAYGISLGRGLQPFPAGLEIFKDETPKALWVSINWIADPIVNAAKDAYAQTFKKLQKPLDREQLQAKLLELVDEKDIRGVPLVEAKERINALKLYAEISGYIGKIDINASTNNTFNETNNVTKIVLVSGSEKERPNIINAPNMQSKIHNEEIPSIPLKLVGGTLR